MSNKILRNATPADPGFDSALKDPVVVQLPDGSEKVVARADADEHHDTVQKPQKPV